MCPSFPHFLTISSQKKQQVFNIVSVHKTTTKPNQVDAYLRMWNHGYLPQKNGYK